MAAILAGRLCFWDGGLLEVPSDRTTDLEAATTVRCAIDHTRAMGADPVQPAARLLGRAGECAALERLLADALAGAGRVVVLRGAAGVGKSALLGQIRRGAGGWRIASANGVESEMELAFGGLHQLCAPLLEHLDLLPDPQRAALETVFGLSAGAPPDRFLVGLATLSLFGRGAQQLPLLCLIDDAHRLDGATAQVLGFVARRLRAERVALVLGARTGCGDAALAGLPELRLQGLAERDLRALLLDQVHGPLDAAVRDQIVAESHGNPRALLELPRRWTPSELAGGFGFPDARAVCGAVEDGYARRLLELPSDTRLLVLAAAAETQGDPVLLHRAVQMLGHGMASADPAVDVGLLTVGRRVAFAHPLARSAAYRSAATDERHRVHRALAEATDAGRDPDRRIWHLARAISGPSEDIAAELERSAVSAQARGGVAAAAAFLQRSVSLTADPARRVDRMLSAAQASVHAAAFETALALIAGAEAGAVDGFQQARVELVRGHVAFASGLGDDAARLLLAAARRLEPFDPALAREACLDALGAALLAGRLGPADELREVAAAAAALGPGADRPTDLLLDGVATLVSAGRQAAAAALRRAITALAGNGPDEHDLRWGWATAVLCSALWDEEAWHVIGELQLRRTREVGALVRLPVDLTTLAILAAWRGGFATAASAIAEAEAVVTATGTRLAPYGALLLAALRGDEVEATASIEQAIAEAGGGAHGFGVQFAQWAAAVLCNGTARYEDALASAREATDAPLDLFPASSALPELIEAAVRSRKPDEARAALERLEQATDGADTDWARGITARCRALVGEGAAAEAHYREAIERLARTRLRTELARAHLLYGEWLRREGRRLDARAALRTAREMLLEIGMEAFAERARRELIATGEKARKRAPETRGDLTAQEEQIARLACEGLSNPEIGARLFISGRTVEWHLRKVFVKLDVSSRGELRSALAEARTLAPA
jgi:DNA-binding CsgD family transcriptional regulator